MEYLLEGIHINPGTSCIYSCMSQCLNHAGYNAKEYLLFFYCGAKYSYSTKNMRDGQSMESRFDFYSIEKLMEALFDRIKLPYHMGQIISADEIYEILRKKQPIITIISQKVLSYQKRIYSIDSQWDRHCILIYGLDSSSNIAVIGDAYVVDDEANILSYNGSFPLDVIEKNAKNYFWLEQRSTDSNTLESVGIVENGLHEYLYSEVGDDGVYHGGQAICQAIMDLQCISTLNGAQRETHCLELAYLLKAYFMLFIEYIIQFTVNELSKFSIQKELLKQLEEVKNDWDNFYRMLIRLSYSKNLLYHEDVIQTGLSAHYKFEQLLKYIVNFIPLLK